MTSPTRLQVIRGLSKVLWEDRAQARWIVRRRADAAYLGWHGRGNLGDEAMFAAASYGAPVPLVPAPLHRASRALARGVHVHTLALGGGTLIGRDEWATRLDAFLAQARVDRLVVLGTGCEDLPRALELGIATERGLGLWSTLLANADVIGVRGPDSRKALSDLGVRSQVVGDLGLLADGLTSARPANLAATVAGRRIGVNVAGVEDGLGRDREHQLNNLVKAVSSLRNRGFAPVFFSMEVEDDVVARRLALAAGIEMRPYVDSLKDLLAFLSTCAAVLSERLHGGILATAIEVPNVMIGYKPKSFDFARSVAMEKRIVSLEEPDPDRLAEMVQRIADATIPAAIREHVAARRTDLRQLLLEIGK